MKKLLIALLATLATGCASSGDIVGGPDRCLTYAYGGCAMKVVNGRALAADTLDLHGRTQSYVNADPKESAIRHAFSGVTDNGGMFIGEKARDPREKPLLN